MNTGSNIAKPGLLVLDRFTEATEARFDEEFDVYRIYSEGFSLTEVCSRIKAIATSGGKGAAKNVMEMLPALEIIAIRGVGTDAVDLEWARCHCVSVTTTPGLLTDDVADLAIGLLLALCRGICVGDAFVRDGRWVPGSGFSLGRKVTGLRIGIVGLGRVGRAIAERAAGFKAKIAYSDVAPFDDVPYEYLPDVLALSRQTDALILAASGGPQSTKIVDRSVIAALGTQGILINVARGSLIDEEALVEALVSGQLGGAALDVFAQEPHVPRALWALENVVLQPHRASATHDTREAMEDLVLQNLAAHFSGKPVLTPV